MLNAIVSVPAAVLAKVIASRSDPGPESAAVVTVKVARRTRYSSRSTRLTLAAEPGWAQTDAARAAVRRAGRRRGTRFMEPPVDVSARRKDERNAQDHKVPMK